MSFKISIFSMSETEEMDELRGYVEDGLLSALLPNNSSRKPLRDAATSPLDHPEEIWQGEQLLADK